MKALIEYEPAILGRNKKRVNIIKKRRTKILFINSNREIINNNI